jgi:dihydrofolate reductase
MLSTVLGTNKTRKTAQGNGGRRHSIGCHKSTIAPNRAQTAISAGATNSLTARRDLSVGDPHLATQAVREGLVDEFRQFLSPFIVSSGTSYLPSGIRQRLRLRDEHRFANGTVYLGDTPVA